jgi:hypothetical protein
MEGAWRTETSAIVKLPSRPRARRMSPWAPGLMSMPSAEVLPTAMRPGSRQRVGSRVKGMPAWCTARCKSRQGYPSVSWRNVVCVARAEHRLPWSVEAPGNTMQFLGTHMPSARAQGCWGVNVGKHHTDTQAIPQGCANLATSIVHRIIIQGATGPTGALPPLLPVSVRRSGLLPKCPALLQGDGSQVNRVRRLCCEGAMFLDWSIVCCSVLLCYYCVPSTMLHVECICGGVTNAGS